VAKKPAKNPDGIKMKRMVGIAVDQKTQLKKHQQLSKLQLDYFETEEEKKASARNYNHKMKDMKATIQRLSRENDSGTEDTEVDVVAVKNFEANEVEYYYEGKVVETREMTDDDRQTDLEDKAPKKKTKLRKNAKNKAFEDGDEANSTVSLVQ